MSTRMIKNRKNGSRLNKLTTQQRRFVLELLASDTFHPADAARAAGYVQPSTAAYKLLKRPDIQAALGKLQREREERCQLKADQVLDYLRRVLYLNPLEWFFPSEDGGWTVSDLSVLPPEVGELIDGMEIKTRTTDDGETHTTFKVTLVSKATALSLAMKHVSVDKHEVKHMMNWDAMYEEQPVVDIVDAESFEVREGS